MQLPQLWDCMSASQLYHYAATGCCAAGGCTCTSSNSIRDMLSSTCSEIYVGWCTSLPPIMTHSSQGCHACLDLKVLVRFCCLHLAPLIDSKPHRPIIRANLVCPCISEVKILSCCWLINCMCSCMVGWLCWAFRAANFEADLAHSWRQTR